MSRKREFRPDRFGYEPDEHLAKEQMEDVVRALNRTRIKTSASKRGVRLPLTEAQEKMRELVGKWRASGPNLKTLFRQNPRLSELSALGAVTLWPSDTGRGYLEWTPATPDDESSSENEALGEFFKLIANPNWKMLAGPCKRCDDYFLKRTSRKRNYCSRGCSGFTTAISAMKKKRMAERKALIARVQAAIAKYEKAKTYWDWKRWVAAEAECSVRWLSRAVNKGDLREPKKSPALKLRLSP
jgi:hypothetical protein